MKLQHAVKFETSIIALGTLALTALMLLGCLIFLKLDLPMLLGALIGCIAASLDFFLLALTVQKAVDIQAQATPQSAVQDAQDGSSSNLDNNTSTRIKRRVRASYYARRLLLIAFALTGLTKYVNLYCVLPPMLFPKFIILSRNLFRQVKTGGSGIE